MNLRIIQERLVNYNCQTEIEEAHALREITQEVVLAALGRGDFFKEAVFQGGTSLRIFYGLNRFSEDLDFLLKKPNPHFSLKNHIKNLSDELAVYGYKIEVSDKSKSRSSVKKAFLKDDSLGKIISLQHSHRSGIPAKINIKLEVDTNPPAGSTHELKYLDFPFVSSVTVQDKPSLFSGKIHALLCRSYLKGRDWYDFIWYTSQGVQPNYKFLSSALDQLGPWQGQSVSANHAWLTKELKRKITTLDWKQAANDVRRFVKVHEQPSLDLWSKDFFFFQLDKLKSVTN